MKAPHVNLKELDQLVEEALERPKDERTAFLRAKCGHDPDLYNEIVSLLDLFDEAEGALGDSAVDYAAPVLEATRADTEEAGLDLAEEIGPYRLLKEIGRGGMGTVYLAERMDGVYDQQVALKLVNVGSTPEFVSRFRSERQILASLSHPGIARLLDGGEAGDGRPYLVMEYISGEPITTYADRKRLPIDQRLKLFEKVCDAVAYAHRNLVVHRDLKPSNVLVSEDEKGDPMVKLLDFGIAKLLTPAQAGLRQEDGEGAQTTTIGSRMVTPDYAAPEQVSGEAITTSTDVYALGVLLYCLLTGHRPYHITSRTRYAIEQAILSAKHVEPSVAVSQTEQWTQADGSTTSITPEEVGAARSTDPQRLSRRLHGDLDTIVLKALRKEPERRYGSAEALGRDITRHLEGLPVEARPDKLGYRIGKFVQRHKTGVATVTLAGLFVIAGAGVAIWQARVASDERNRAQLEADKAHQVVTLLTDVFTAADPFGTEGPDVPVGRLLEASIPRFHETLADQPAVLATLLSVVGHVQSQWGRFEEAASLLEEAKHIIDSTGVDPVTRLEVLQTLTVVFTEAGRLEEAEPIQREVLALEEARHGLQALPVATASNGLASIVESQGDMAEAEALYRRAISIRRTAGDRSTDLAANLNNLAGLLMDRGENGEAVLALEEALSIVEAELGPDHPYAGFALSALGRAQQGLGEMDNALASYDRAVGIGREALGNTHPFVASALHNRATLLRDTGRADAALIAFREALEVRRAGLPEGHADVAYSLTGLGNALTEAGRVEEGELLLREAVTIRREALPSPHWLTAIAEGYLGIALGALSRFSEAEPLLTTSYEVLRQEFGPDNERTLRAAQRLAEFYSTANRPDEAARWDALAGQ